MKIMNWIIHERKRNNLWYALNEKLKNTLYLCKQAKNAGFVVSEIVNLYSNLSELFI